MSDKNVLELNNIVKRYGQKCVFDNFSLSVEKGEMLCISGPSGSGKSTLLSIIGMFESVDSGEVKIFGEPLPALNSKKSRNLMRDKIFYLFQNYALVEDETINYNLEIPLMGFKIPKKQKKQLKMDALGKVGISAPLDEKIFHLSGGEQQRVAIARGYLKKFDLVLADEPTGSLDKENRDNIISILHDFHDMGKTVIVVTHDSTVMESCERIVKIC